MGLQPKIGVFGNALERKKCARCGKTYETNQFAPINSLLFPDKLLPWCNNCADQWLAEANYSWPQVNKLCQLADIPFVPKEFERIKELAATDIFYRYAIIFRQKEYEGVDWSTYDERFRELAANGSIDTELPLLDEAARNVLRERWGPNYDDEALRYLEDLYNGLLTTQNINGKLQRDQALKVCKMSYEIDCRIRAGEDFDKLLASYDKMVKAGEFTPKNVKNINDFDSVGELVTWMEKKGWRNKFFDGVSRDIVDETIANIQAFNRRLYTNEPGIGEEITSRIQALQNVHEMEQQENYYLEENQKGLDSYENDSYNGLFKDEEFDPQG